jgi:hypothetical protein
MRGYDAFLASTDERAVLVVRGAAGTGKSRLIGEFANQARVRGFIPVLAAPTGRAARVLGERAAPATASTIHRLIYSFDELEEEVDDSEQPVFHYRLKSSDDPANLVFLIDEASMIGDQKVESTNLRFGSGRLLSDLLKFAFWAHPGGRRKVVFIGDHCQLPPIDSDFSPALDAGYLRSEHNCTVADVRLVDIVRQQRESGILATAGRMRDMIEQRVLHTLTWPESDQLRVVGAAPEFESTLKQSWGDRVPPHIVCFTNARVRDWNNWTRQLLGRWEQDPMAGDKLLVIQNHGRSGLLNGDFADVDRVGPRVTRSVKGVDLHFREVVVRYISPLGEQSWAGQLLENLLLSPERALTDAENQARWILFKMDHPGLKVGTVEFCNAVLSDPWWNCLCAKFGYASTCHKAQGGEWDEVFVDPETSSRGRSRSVETLRWLYTVITRAKTRLTILAPPVWSAGEGLLRQTAAVAERYSVPGSVQGESRAPLEHLVLAAIADRGWPAPQLSRHPYLLRCVWNERLLKGRLDVRYKGDGQPSEVVWTGDTTLEPTMTLCELQARWWLGQSPQAPMGIKAGIAQVLDRLRAAASQENLSMRVQFEQYAFRLVFVDESNLAAGAALVRVTFNGLGQTTSLRQIDVPEQLSERLGRLIQKGARHE